MTRQIIERIPTFGCDFEFGGHFVVVSALAQLRTKSVRVVAHKQFMPTLWPHLRKVSWAKTLSFLLGDSISDIDLCILNTRRTRVGGCSLATTRETGATKRQTGAHLKCPEIRTELYCYDC